MVQFLRLQPLARLALVGLLAATCLGAFAAPRPARAQGFAAPRLVLPVQGALHAGQRVELRWSGDTGEVEELEIMLTLDGPQRRTIQVTPEMDPGRGVFVWRVPELGSCTGRLRVRFEHDGQEVEGAPSARITFFSGLAAPFEPVLRDDPAAPAPALPTDPAAERDRTTENTSDASTALAVRARAIHRSEPGPPPAPVTQRFDAPIARTHSQPEFVPPRN